MKGFLKRTAAMFLTVAVIFAFTPFVPFDGAKDSYAADGDTQITYINIDIPVPQAGESFVCPDGETDQYSYSTEWIVVDNSSDTYYPVTSGTFERGVTYSARFRLVPKLGYTLENYETETTLAVNGDTSLPEDRFFIGYTNEVLMFHATWQVPGNDYTVSFAGNGGSGSMSSATVKENNYYKLPENGFGVPSEKRFTGWSVNGQAKNPGDRIKITGNTTVTATWADIPKYTVTFCDHDGTQISTGDYAEGTPIADIAPADPTRDPTPEYEYTFAGWATSAEQTTGQQASALPDVSRSITYYAAFTRSDRTYLIQFLDDNGGVVQSSQVKYGVHPSYEGGEPTKEADPQYTYTFKGWRSSGVLYDGELPAVMGAADYQMEFEGTVNKYKVKFVDEDGASVLLAEKEYAYGTTAAEIEKPEDPTKEATEDYTYVFGGWSPEISSVTKHQTYTATYKQLDNYHLAVEDIHARTTAGTGDVSEADGKSVSISTTSWTATAEDAAKLQAYFAGYHEQTPVTFRDKFQAGETYYSVAIVTFNEGETADPSRVSIVETDTIKQVGEAVVNTEENSVIIAFSATIPAVTVTVEFGAGHEAYAAAVAAAFEDVDVTVSGTSLQYKAEKGTDRWFDVLSPIRGALYEMEERTDNDERLYPSMGGGVNMQPMAEYADAEAWYADVDAEIYDHGDQDEDLTVCVQWQKATGAKIIIGKPVCGTEITLNEETHEQTPAPEITVASGNVSVTKELLYWIDTSEGMMKQFSGMIKGGEKYTAMFMLSADFGYYVDYDKVTVTNGNLLKTEFPGDVVPHLIEVEAVHEFGEGEVIKEPTAKAKGKMAYKCKNYENCEAARYEPIDKVTYEFTQGGSSTWTIGDSGTLDFTVERSYKDEDTYDKWFTGTVKVDGKAIGKKDFTAEKGSVKLALNASYLDTLSAGKHKVTVVFEDAEVSADFTVVGAGRKNKPAKTGDAAAMASAWLMLITAGLALAATGYRRKTQ